MTFERIIKIVLAILFFLCLLDMPYGFYQLVRFIALVCFGILAYQSYENENNIIALIYIGLAILFQPLIKISLGREIWNIVDIIVGISLIVSIFIKRKKMADPIFKHICNSHEPTLDQKLQKSLKSQH